MSFASLCVLSYERPELLRACLESIRDAGAPFELIVHDDGSLNSRIKPYLGKLHDEGLISTLILQPPGRNEGVGEAVRKMFAVAQGDLLIKVDQDLLFEHGWLARVREMFEDPYVGCAGLFKYFHDPVDHEKMLIREAPGGKHSYVRDFVGSAFAIRSRLYRVLGPIDSHSPAFSEDVGLKQRVREAGEGGLKYELALPEEALAMNVGFGIGPDRSTVNMEWDDSVEGGVRIRGISDRPVIFSGTWS